MATTWVPGSKPPAGPEEPLPPVGGGGVVYPSRFNTTDLKGAPVVPPRETEPQPTRKGGWSVKRTVATGAAVLAAVTTAVVGVATLGGERGPGDRTPGTSAGDFPDRTGGEGAENPGVGSPFEAANNALDNPSQGLANAIADALGLETAPAPGARLVDVNLSFVRAVYTDPENDLMLATTVQRTDGNGEFPPLSKAFVDAGIEGEELPGLPGWTFYDGGDTIVYEPDGSSNEAVYATALATNGTIDVHVDLHVIDALDSSLPGEGDVLRRGVAEQLVGVVQQ